MRHTIELRDARDDDREFCYRVARDGLYDAAVATYGRWDEDYSRARFAERWGVWPYQVIVVDGVDAGVCCRLREDDGDVLGVIALASAFQNRGIGTALMRRFMTDAQDAGRALDLDCIKGNRAKALYERLGFAVVAEQEDRWTMRLG